MIGPKLGLFPDSWFVGFGFYWFCLMFYKRCQPEIFSRFGGPRWSGFAIFWKPNASVRPGDYLWLKHKEWGSYAA